MVDVKASGPAVCVKCVHSVNQVWTRFAQLAPSVAYPEHEYDFENKDLWHCAKNVIRKRYDPITGTTSERIRSCSKINEDGRCPYFDEIQTVEEKREEHRSVWERIKGLFTG